MLSYLKSIVGPTTKFHITFLIVKWEPSDVDFTGAFEYTRWDILAAPIISNHYVCWVGTIKTLVRPVECAENDLFFT